MKVKCIKDIAPCVKGEYYKVIGVYIADKHSPHGESVMELMYSIDEGDGCSIGVSASYFNVEDDLSKMEPLMYWVF